MKKISMLLVLFGLIGCKSGLKKIPSDAEERIFSEIFTVSAENNEGLPQLNKLKFYQGLYSIDATDKKRLATVGGELIKSLKRNYPDFFKSFNQKMQTGDPLIVEEALLEGCNIVWATIMKDSANVREAVALNHGLSEADKALYAKINATTDYREALKLVSDSRNNGFFTRTIKFNRRLGLESFRLPYENNEATQYLPNVDYTYKDITPYWNFALAGNVAIIHDAILASELFIVVVLVIGNHIQSPGETSLLRDKVINELTQNYKR